MSLFVFLATKLLCLLTRKGLGIAYGDPIYVIRKRSVAIFFCIFSVCACNVFVSLYVHFVFSFSCEPDFVSLPVYVKFVIVHTTYMYLYLYSFACLFVSQPVQCMLY